MPSLADRMQYRALVFACLYGPPVPVSREEALQVYGTLSKNQCPTASFQYTPPEADDLLDFKVVVAEKEGRRSCNITVDVQNGLLRTLVDQSFPTSFPDGCGRADDIHKLLSGLVSRSEPQLVEVRIRAQAATNAKSAQDFLAGNLMGSASSRLPRLGQLGHLGFRYEVIPQARAESALDAPARQVVAEPLREEASSLYVEVMSNWGRALLRPVAGSKGHEVIPEGPLTYGLQKASAYFGEVSTYISETLCPFLEAKL